MIKRTRRRKGGRGAQAIWTGWGGGWCQGTGGIGANTLKMTEEGADLSFPLLPDL